MTRSDVIRGANGFPAIAVDFRRPEDPSAACTPTDSSNTLEDPIPRLDVAVASTRWGSVALFFGDVLACASGAGVGGFVEFVRKISFSRPWLRSTWLLAALAIPLVRVIVGRTLTTAGNLGRQCGDGRSRMPRCRGQGIARRRCTFRIRGDRRGPLTVYTNTRSVLSGRGSIN
jgi:hypothetical protein